MQGKGIMGMHELLRGTYSESQVEQIVAELQLKHPVGHFKQYEPLFMK
jgi:hypothetical protein